MMPDFKRPTEGTLGVSSRLNALRDAGLSYVLSMMGKKPIQVDDFGHVVLTSKLQIDAHWDDFRRICRRGGVELGCIAIARWDSEQVQIAWVPIEAIEPEQPQWDERIVKPIGGTFAGEIRGIPVPPPRTEAESFILNHTNPLWAEFTMQDGSRVRIDGGDWRALPPDDSRTIVRNMAGEVIGTGRGANRPRAFEGPQFGQSLQKFFQRVESSLRRELQRDGVQIEKVTWQPFVDTTDMCVRFTGPGGEANGVIMSVENERIEDGAEDGTSVDGVVMFTLIEIRNWLKGFEGSKGPNEGEPGG